MTSRLKLPVEKRPASAQWLRESRIKLGLTQAELAEILGVHANTVIRWELRGITGIATSQAMIEEKIQQLLEEGGKRETEYGVDTLGRVYPPTRGIKQE